MNNFKGRSLAVINDLSLDERLYLFEKARKLKKAMHEKDSKTVDSFRINDPDKGVYLVFLEDSTRTKESSGNAADFHRVKSKVLDTEHTSFNKKESYADTFNMLTGYDSSIFVVRSKLEGVCRWLEINGKAYAKRNGLSVPPAFVNAGDGKHEHPTQELLDELTFLEDNNWDRSNIHLALVGDLFHGRTVHSKVDGLNVFDNVAIDLVAPPDIAMPEHYIKRMRSNGFEVRTFGSIDEYLSQEGVASKWYFTRPQLERMGEDILKKQGQLRAAITFKKEHMKKVPDGTGFYHPLPRHKEHPTIPLFLDGTSLNRWEAQSRNGYIMRVILLSAIGGRIGDDFSGETVIQREFVDDFIDEVKVQEGTVKQYAEGVRPIKDGIVIDHIGKGDPVRDIEAHLYKVINALGLHSRGGYWVSRSKKDGMHKGILFRPDYEKLGGKQVKKLGALAPGSTVNIIRDHKVVKKLRVHTPPRIYGFDEISCKSDACISHPQYNEGVPAEFHRAGKDAFTCMYCETPHTFREIWKKTIK